MAADAALVSDLLAAIARTALAEPDGQTLLKMIGRRLVAAGMPVSRLSVAWRTLDPLIFAHQVIWTRGKLIEDDFSHADADAMPDRQSPLRYIVEHAIPFYRADLTLPNQPFEHFEEFAAAGHTEYIGGVERFGPDFTPPTEMRDQVHGVFLSACSDAQGGFGEWSDLFQAIKPTLAIAFRAIIEERKVHAIARTYLGVLSAERMLAGAIRRGDAEVVPAVIWYSDMRSFTSLSEQLSLDDTIAFLNEVFEATAGAVEAAGGHVLDFIGDAVLAIFPLGDDGLRRALVALDDALDRLAGVRAAHGSDRREPIRISIERGLVGIALAVGDVRFGNIGTMERLAFSVIGPTVNTVARIETQTKELGEPVLVTEAVAAAAPERFILRGRPDLVGVANPPRLYALAGAGRSPAAMLPDVEAASPVA